MFSQVSACSQGRMSHVTITYDAFDLTVPTPQTWYLVPTPSPLPPSPPSLPSPPPICIGQTYQTLDLPVTGTDT